MGDELAMQFGSMGLQGSENFDGADGQIPLDSNSQEYQNGSDGNFAGSACNLIVNYLPHDVDDGMLRQFFQEFGEIIMTKVVRDKNTKKSLGYGFVKFSKESEAMLAIEKMHGYTMGHKVLKVSIARPPSLEIRNCKLYVTNLPKEYGERDVVGLFQEFGEIIECRVLRDKNSKYSKGVAFVQFNLKAQATSALSLNGCQLEGASRGLVVKFAEDQHKKKELNRLHNLTMTAGFRGPGAPPNGHNQMGGHMGGMNRGMGNGSPDEGHGANQQQNYFYPPPPQSPAMGSLYGRQQQGAINGGSMNGMYMPPPSPTVPSPILDYSGSKNGGANRKSLQLDIPSFPQMQSTPASWYPPVSSPHLSYVPSPTNMVHMGVHPNNFEFGGDFSPGGHNLHSMQHHIGQLGTQFPPPATSPQVGHSLTPFGRIGHQQNPLSLSNGISPSSLSGKPGTPMSLGMQGPQQGQPQQQQQPPQQHQAILLSISNLPRETSPRSVHGLVASYGQVLDVQLEEQFFEGPPGSRGGSTGFNRARLVMGNYMQAEEAIRQLNGAVLFEGVPPLQVNFV